MKRLYELITDTRIKFGEQFLNEAFELMLMEDEDLKRYINDFQVNYSLETIGSYNNDERKIRVNPYRITQLADAVYSTAKIQSISTIKHEMEHASNLRRMYEGGFDIESIIVRYSLVDYLARNNIKNGIFLEEDAGYLAYKRKENYVVDPGERLADIKAEKYVVNLLKNQRRTIELLIAKSKLYFAYVRGYTDNGVYLDAPTYTFLLNMGMFREFYLLKRRVDSQQYKLDTRVCLGLPLTYEEKDEVILRRMKLQKREDKIK